MFIVMCTPFDVVGILIGYHWFFVNFTCGVSTLRGGTYPGMSSTASPFLDVESSPPVVEGPMCASTLTLALVVLLVVLFFCDGDLGQLGPLFFHVTGDDTSGMLVASSLIGMPMTGESLLLPLEISYAIVVL